MDTQRSEYSEDGGASTFRSGYGGSVASLSYSQAGSHDSRSSRSSFLNNYEQKFLKRKAEKKKKKERETKNNQIVISTEERFKADREADRQARKLEMAAWMTPPTVLKRIELANRKRSRERMKGVLEWYSSMGQEMQPTFTPPTNGDGAESSASVDPIVQEKLENQQQALAVTLERQLMELKMKLACVERLTEEPHKSPAKQLVGPGKIRRRRAGPGHQLSPLHEERQATISNHAASLSQLPATIPSRMSGSASTGALQQQKHSNSSLDTEDAADKAELERFLKLHRRLVGDEFMVPVCIF